MKKKITAACLAACMMMALVVPVKADTVSDAVANQYMMMQLANMAINAQLSAQSDPATEEKIDNMVRDAKTYADYLNQVVLNRKETKRIKREVLTNYKNLSKVNPSFKDLIPAAKAEFDKASGDVKAMKEVARRAAEFANSGVYIRTYAKYMKDTYKSYEDAGKFVMTAIGVNKVF